jgi:GMP synthase-like glutamine amidotransferase
MILYVDMEHKNGFATPRGPRIMAGRLKVKYRIEDITNDVCLVRRYHQVTPQTLIDFDVRAVLVSGSGTDPELYKEEELAGIRAVFRSGMCPVLGLCGGWQFMAQAFGSKINPLGPLDEDDPVPNDPVIFSPGMKQEYGFLPVEIAESHPFFQGLGEKPVFWHAHYLEVNPPPPGFYVYARTDLCAVQLAGHKELPLYGTQFHPEHYDEQHPDGKVVLQNFFRLVGVIE